MIAPYSASSLVNLFKLENKSQFRLLKDLNSTEMYDFLIHGNKPVTLYSIMLTFRDSNKSFNLDGDLLKTMANYQFSVGHSNPQDRKVILEFAEEMNFDIKNTGRPSTRDKCLIKLLSSSAIMAFGTSTMFLTSDLDEIFNRIKILLRKKQAGNNSDKFNDEIFTIVDNLLEDKCISVKQHKQFLKNCNLLHTKKVSINTHTVGVITHIDVCIHKCNCT